MQYLTEEQIKNYIGIDSGINTYKLPLDSTYLKPKLDMAMTFTNRESYLNWVLNWKQQYKELTAEIRQQKKNRRIECPLTEYISQWDGKVHFYLDRAHPSYKLKNAAVGLCYKYRCVARGMLFIRHHARKVSQEMKHSKQQPAIVPTTSELQCKDQKSPTNLFSKLLNF